MSLLQQEIENVVKNIIIPDPIFKLKKRRDEISINKQFDLTANIESPIKNKVLDYVRLEWDNKNLLYKIKHADCKESIRYNILDEIKNFIYRNSSSQNPRLTSLYKWYNQAIDRRSYQQYFDLEDTLFATWKYMISDITRPHKKNVLNVLEVIKQKFENKGLTK